MRGWLAAVTLAAILPHQASAQGYVDCIQAQLNALGHDVGQIDGQLSAEGLVASQSVQGDDLPPLTQRTAFEWCRGLSEKDVSLRAYWPALDPDIVVVPKALIGTAAEDLSRRAHADARSFFLGQYGLELVGGFAFIVGDQAATVQDAAIDLRTKRNGSTRLGFEKNPMPCGTDGGLRAIAFRDMALFCWGADGEYDAAWADEHRYFYTRSFVHEYAHGLQNELSGVDARPILPSGERTLGPKWLVEGAAETVEEEYYAAVTRFSERSLGRQRKIILGNDTPLSALRDKVTIGSDYDVSQFAVFLLGERFGRAALFEYFSNLRYADSWDEAFRATFDMSLDAFEEEYQTMRSNLVPAYRFGKGE
ncbi:hypothetical protein [Tateyamaria sp.]|uniref:hypothetical protein n=1 Tax=Tateyamaria sp. TaxID=1929288 RepID=UPI00329E2867